MDKLDLYSLGDVAKLLECQQYRISYLLTTRRDLEPALRVGNRRLFTAAEVECVHVALNHKEKKWKST